MLYYLIDSNLQMKMIATSVPYKANYRVSGSDVEILF